MPLHTLRADIDYGFAEALTTFGIIGVKVWIYRGEILDPKAAMARGTTVPIRSTKRAWVSESDARVRVVSVKAAVPMVVVRVAKTDKNIVDRIADCMHIES